MSNLAGMVSGYESEFLTFLFQYRIEFFVAFVLLFVGRKMYRANKGGKYTRLGLVLSPLGYLGLTGFTFIGLDTIGLLICAISFAVGLALSGVLRGQLYFFEQNNQLYYRRSVFTVLTWTVAFVFRLYLFIFYDITVGLVLSVILSYIAGLFLGEAFQIAIHKRMFDFEQMQKAAAIDADPILEL